jgi:hypothetical protein
MKFGIRKPSLKKSLAARTTGRAKRAVKRAIIPGYGRKGMGWIKNPKKAVYNKIYRKTSISIFKLLSKHRTPHRGKVIFSGSIINVGGVTNRPAKKEQKSRAYSMKNL